MHSFRVGRSVSNGSIRKKGIRKGRTCDAREEEGNVEERPVGEESEEPQTSDRHRSFGSAEGRRQGAEEEIVEILFEEEVSTQRAPSCAWSAHPGREASRDPGNDAQRIRAHEPLSAC